MDPDGRLAAREPRRVAPFVYAGVGVIKPQLFEGVAEDVFRLAPFFYRAAEKGRLSPQAGRPVAAHRTAPVDRRGGEGDRSLTL